MLIWLNKRDKNNHSLELRLVSDGVELLFTVVKPGGSSCQKTCVVKCTQEEARVAFLGVGPTWQEEVLDPDNTATHFKARRTVRIKTAVGDLLLVWNVDHLKLEEGVYKLQDSILVEQAA